jgi:aryl-phospho-beta-D-glucosidase BglC (GH1 family)
MALSSSSSPLLQIQLFFLFLLLSFIHQHGAIAPSTFGPLSTAGNQIIDTTGEPVRLAGISWFGFESEYRTLEGLALRSYQSYIDQMKGMGFNTIRIPFASQVLIVLRYRVVNECAAIVQQ